MSKPYLHAVSSAKHFGGEPEDYIEIHTFIDSSKGAIADNRHRALTHNSWFLMNVLERVRFQNSYVRDINQLTFPTITNSAGKRVSVRDIGEQHILEDFRKKFIPSAQDYLAEIEFMPWMQNGEGLPPSFRKIGKPGKPKAEDTVIDGRKPDIVTLPHVLPPAPPTPCHPLWPWEMPDPGIPVRD